MNNLGKLRAFAKLKVELNGSIEMQDFIICIHTEDDSRTTSFSAWKSVDSHLLDDINTISITLDTTDTLKIVTTGIYSAYDAIECKNHIDEWLKRSK